MFSGSCQKGSVKGSHNWLISGIIIGELIAYLILSQLVCILKQRKESDNVNDPLPETHYDEIGTINYNIVFNEHLQSFAQNESITNITKHGEGESESSSNISDGTTFNTDGFENPYQPIITELIKTHAYSQCDVEQETGLPVTSFRHERICDAYCQVGDNACSQTTRKTSTTSYISSLEEETDDYETSLK